MNDLHRRIVTQEGVTTFVLEKDALLIMDQRALPTEEINIVCRTVDDVAVAIETLGVRGAPAIGGAAALALALLVRTKNFADVRALRFAFDDAHARLAKTRPTAVNLFYALDKVARAFHDAESGEGADVSTLLHAIVDAAERVCTEDAAACAALGRHGAGLFDDGARILTICHTGALATCGIGTALGVVRTAHEQGKRVEVFALETRPLLQGARLTAWECEKLGIPVTLLTDGMAGFAFARKGITAVIVGADRIAKNGDTANKIGTYGVSVLALAHGVPFYVAAPSSTFDVSTPTGDDIVIEERDADEVRRPRGTVFSPPTVRVWNPAFDVTPALNIRAFVSERGVHDADGVVVATRP